MTTVLDIAQAVASEIGIDVPSVVFGSDSRQLIELAAVFNKARRDIQRAYDWRSLRKLATFEGNNTTASFDMPSDYERMIEEAEVWSSRLQFAMTHVDDPNVWQGMLVRQDTLVANAWTLYDEQMHFLPVLAAGESATFLYIKNTAVKSSTGELKTAFTSDEDTFVLSPDLLELAVIWKWRESKGLPYAEKLQNYETLKSKIITADRGAREMIVGGKRKAQLGDVAYASGLGPGPEPYVDQQW